MTLDSDVAAGLRALGGDDEDLGEQANAALRAWLAGRSHEARLIAVANPPAPL